jgi:hypothetical protein
MVGAAHATTIADVITRSINRPNRISTSVRREKTYPPTLYRPFTACHDSSGQPIAAATTQDSYAVVPRVDLKQQPNRQLYIKMLRRITPAQRLVKAMELSDLGKRLYLHGLRKRFPGDAEPQLRACSVREMARCHNRRN